MTKPVTTASFDWAEKTLADAFFAIDAMIGDYHPETDAHMYLKQALDAIENADVAIEKGQ